MFCLSLQARYQASTELVMEQHGSVCRDLSKEVAVQEQVMSALQEQCDATRWERDELAIENLRLKAQAATYIMQQAEYSEMKRRYLEDRQRGIQGATEAIESRDKVIDDLTSKLTLALDQLEREREQHRQRRQIIFTPSPSVTGVKKS